MGEYKKAIIASFFIDDGFREIAFSG